MLFQSFSLTEAAAALFLLTTVVSAFHDPLAPHQGITFKKVKGNQERTADVPTVNYQAITVHRGRGRKHSRSAAVALGAVQRMNGGGAYENVTSETIYGTEYDVEIGWGGYPMTVALDTGSSDTWVVQHDFECISPFGETVDQEACMFGPTYPGTFSGGPIFDQHMYTQYGDGEIVVGPLGYEDITIAKITVAQQEVCLANMTFWEGDNITSGIIGLAYPSLTNAYYGPDDEHDWFDEIQYPPIFSSMVQQGLSKPYFAIALHRNSSTGVISFGGPPPLPNIDYGNTAETPIIVTNLNDNPYAAWEYSFYTIIPDAFTYNQVTDTTKYPMIIDSGTTLLYLPTDLAEAINGLFQPAATYLFEWAAYFTTCNAIVPMLSITIGGKRFHVNPRDMIYRNVVDPMTGLCMSAVNDGGEGPFILGDVFLQNVVAIFDVGNASMRFAGRPYY